MRTYNDEPRPRALLEDLAVADSSRVERMFPYSRVGAAGDDFYEPEIDVLVSGASSIGRDRHMHVVAFGSSYLGQATPPQDAANGTRGAIQVNRAKTLATELHVPSQVSGEVGALVQSDLVPLFSAMVEKPALSVFLSEWSGVYGVKVIPWCTPLLVAGDGSVLAAYFQRLEGGMCWVLPAEVSDPAAWVAVALKQFREVDPDRVPALPSWWENPQWATPEQREARAAARRIEAERNRINADLERQLVAAGEGISVADETAADGPARLLTSDGDRLADAVRSALEGFGFAVRDMDEVFAEGDRREDLRVRDPDLTGWEAILEIKGYTRGAAVNDLARIARWSGSLRRRREKTARRAVARRECLSRNGPGCPLGHPAKR